MCTSNWCHNQLPCNEQINTTTTTIPSSQNQWIWLKPRTNSEFDIPIGCRILRYDRGKILVKDDDNRESWVTPDQVIHKHMSATLLIDDNYISISTFRITYQQMIFMFPFILFLLFFIPYDAQWTPPDLQTNAHHVNWWCGWHDYAWRSTGTFHTT